MPLRMGHAVSNTYNEQAEVEIRTDDPNRSIVSTVATLSQAPYFSGLFSWPFASLPKTSAGRFELRLPNFSHSAAKAVVNQLRTGVGPRPCEMRSDKRAEYERLADYLGVKAAVNSVTTEPAHTFCENARLSTTDGHQIFYVRDDPELSVWRAPTLEEEAPEHLLTLHERSAIVCGLVVHEGYLLVATNTGEYRRTPAGWQVFATSRLYSIDLDSREACLNPIEERSCGWQKLEFLQTATSLLVQRGSAVYSWSPPESLCLLPNRSNLDGVIWNGHAEVEFRPPIVDGESPAPAASLLHAAHAHDDIVELIDLRTRIVLSRIREGSRALSLLFHDNSLWIAFRDKTVRQYDCATGQRKCIIKLADEAVQLHWLYGMLITRGTQGRMLAWDVN